MNPQQIITLLHHYDDLLSNAREVDPKRCVPYQHYVGVDRESENKQWAHIRWMITEMRPTLAKLRIDYTQKDMDKMQRWLGFVQGALWTSGIATIEDLRQDNKPDAERTRCSGCEKLAGFEINGKPWCSYPCAEGVPR